MYKVEIINKGDMVFNVKSGDSEFIIDAKGKGFTPPDALLAGLGSCIGVYLRKYIEGAGLELKEFVIKTEAEFSKEKPVCFRNIFVSVDLKGVQLGEQRQKALIDFIKNCPVHNTLKSDPLIEIRII